MKFIGLSNCDTCKKARTAIAAAGLPIEITDIRKDGLDQALISSILDAHGDSAINKSSTTWRGLSDDEKEKPAAELLAAYPTLLKRPAILKDGMWHLGWKPAQQQAVLD
ncbi:arsenate reductase family protein [Ketogulonicigenium vulgare]|uniref:Arsenate reductase and related protein n=1 Tax=Ketogulonicigenium vulgare (strain WSH-001) TaxID=759362 RepID=F9Y9I4_KETVW|nr:ArsC/Spx/MgsR family protein [Ketogulonicigenium vulgare]ADO41942.1 arsenate reductase-like protein [Ketogulonicigenium vulgare Y25]AEM40166.1 Arsenate reductase and related protein [Ketogulonicigenium vulgare WSH-001]ALJ80372.1 arsenate reductase [Ketogulonicigenium vulgare]ANW33206.1 arsenate reductase [Ketogulonicigenium vulgare]AOZ53867.1 arsenate reductase [Ketogulonicigenium vulgare]